ncbi:hypothetical protein BD626DRAFT_253179 [Schizophyllum amplum]|uniref:Uncharacterized protein n=1 Tax=Schizophyllum amplum TaxID=97359 RepID=A0A550CI61_9AGAR|nr:hypothetical protein BD626DRAFT_253179 [Auriculariopsis ampla]
MAPPPTSPPLSTPARPSALPQCARPELGIAACALSLATRPADRASLSHSPHSPHACAQRHARQLYSRPSQIASRYAHRNAPIYHCPRFHRARSRVPSSPLVRATGPPAPPRSTRREWPCNPPHLHRSRSPPAAFSTYGACPTAALTYRHISISLSCSSSTIEFFWFLCERRDARRRARRRRRRRRRRRWAVSEPGLK